MHHKQSNKIFLGLILGTLVGLLFNKYSGQNWVHWILNYITAPIGTAFLRSLMMVVVPLVFASLAAGVTKLGSGQNVRLVFGKLGLYYLGTTLIAILIGQVLVNTIQPGAGISQNLIENSREQFASQVSQLIEKSEGVSESLWPGLVSTVIPKNIIGSMANGDMLAIIFVAILIGLALLHNPSPRSDTFLLVLESISHLSITIVGWIMKTAPYAVAALMITSVSQLGFEIIDNIGKYVGVVILGYLCQLFITYPLLLKFLIKMNPVEFFKRAAPAIFTAFSTSSSNATIPTTTKILEEEFQVPPEVTNFSVPLGATVNMDGTALFEMVAAMFIAQIFGVEIGLMGHFSLIILVLLTSVGVAGVPGGSIPILMSAMAIVGIPPEGIAIVLGVDRLLDMGRTTVNVTGDITATLYVNRFFKCNKSQSKAT